ncbi:MAG: hypothetical protein V4447_04250 [Pseudomonadota bacterium]
MNKLKIKLNIKILVLLLLALQGGNVSAESGRLGAGFFGFGKNNVEGGNASTKETMRQKQAKKAAALKSEKRSAAAQDEQGKELNAPNSENSNSNSRKSRMTPEERRALRRQIHDAGSEVYVAPK